MNDSIPNASMPLASANPKDHSKNKKVNHSAKLKNRKLDARREQWLSQGKNNGGHEDMTGGTRGGRSMGSQRMEKIEIKSTSVDENYRDRLSLHHYSDLETSVANSPASYTSSTLCSNDSGINFSASGRSSSQCSIDSNGSFSCNMSEDSDRDAGDNGCLDDWEAMADALAATSDKQKGHTPESRSGSQDPAKHSNVAPSGSEFSNRSRLRVDLTKSKQQSRVAPTNRSHVNRGAWCPDDAFRPQGLPRLSKQYSLPSHGASVWRREVVRRVPISCPICCEDLDSTDEAFNPCLCGFQLCLFCYNRILEQDARCPACRGQYNYEPVKAEASLDGGTLTLRLDRSCSMITRS